jgi:hypothetical protein
LEGWRLRSPYGGLTQNIRFFTTASGTAAGLCQKNRISESGFNWGFVDSDPGRQKRPANKKKVKKYHVLFGGLEASPVPLEPSWRPDITKHQIFLQLLQEPLLGPAKTHSFSDPGSIGVFVDSDPERQKMTHKQERS